MALGSLVWVATLLGVVFPDVGTFLIAFVPVPDFVEESWVRLAMLAAAVLLPLLIGGAGIYVSEGGRPAHARPFVGSLLRGYPFAALLATTIAFLAVVALVRRLRALVGRQADAHVPMVVKPGGYGTVVSDLRGVLESAGLHVKVHPAPSALSAPARLLDRVAGRSLGRLVPDRLMLLSGPGLECLVYPSDVAIVGERRAVSRARAAIAARLTESPAWLTVTKESQQIEDRITSLARSRPSAEPAVLDEIGRLDRTLLETAVPYEEWETLYRQRLQVERDILRRERRGDVVARPDAAAGTAGRRQAAASRLDRILAVSVIALLALDLAVLIADAVRRTNRR